MKIVKNFQLKIVIFTAVKNRCILNGRVFVMTKLPTHIHCMTMTNISLNDKYMYFIDGFAWSSWEHIFYKKNSEA